jgi:hypothetical protein
MMRVCKICGYETNRRFNLLRHHTTRAKCKNEDEDAVVTNDKIQDGQNTYVFGQNTYAPLKCSKCSKVLKSKKRLKEHEAKCDGFDKKQCNICLKVFSSREGKYQHQKNVQCTPPLGESPIDRNNLNKPINFSETRITRSLVQELLQYDGSLHDFYFNVPNQIEICISIAKLIFFNPKYPQYHNIRFTNIQPNYVYIRIYEDGWTIQRYKQNEVFKQITNSILSLFSCNPDVVHISDDEEEAILKLDKIERLYRNVKRGSSSFIKVLHCEYKTMMYDETKALLNKT